MVQGMLNRRFLRMKAFQAIYAFKSSNGDLIEGEKKMMMSIEEVETLYLYLIQILGELQEIAEQKIEQNKNKNFATEEDLNPNLKFVNNAVLRLIVDNEELQKMMKNHKVSWDLESDNLKKLWNDIANSELYDRYMNDPRVGYHLDKEFVIKMFKEFIVPYEILHDILEDKNIYWYDDLAIVAINVIKSINGLKKETIHDTNWLAPLYKDEVDDVLFVKELYRKTMLNEEDLEKRIEKYIKNWDVDRIAKIDMTIMEMALSEFLYQKSVPVKVTMNEYIELAKDYSTPKSKVFINGILDKMVVDLKDSGELQKTGRGLIS